MLPGDETRNGFSNVVSRINFLPMSGVLYYCNTFLLSDVNR